MSTKGVEGLIKKVLHDSQFKSRFDSNPEEVFPEFDLTTEERDAVMRVQQRLSLAATGSEQVAIASETVPLATWY